MEEDYAATTANGAFTAIPLQGQNNVQQIRNYIAARCPYVKSYIQGLGFGGNLLYRLEEETALDGVDDYIDTGVKLFDEAKDFTIICDATLAEGYGLSSGIYNALQNDSGGAVEGGGLVCNTHWGWSGAYTINGRLSSGNSSNVFATVTAPIVKHALVYKEGNPFAVYYLTEDGGAIQTITQFENATQYSQHNYPLIIGCRVGWYNAANEAFTAMTVHAFEVWDYAMTAEEVAGKLA